MKLDIQKFAHKQPTINSITISELNSKVRNIGVSGDFFILGLSNKLITIDATYYDSATFDHIEIINTYYDNGEKTQTTTLNRLELGYSGAIPYIKDNENDIRLAFIVYDNKGGSTRFPKIWPFPNYLTYDYMEYEHVTIDATAERVTQTSNDVKISISGTYCNKKIGDSEHYRDYTGNYKPYVYYKYWEAGQSQPQWTRIPNEDIITNAFILTEDTTFQEDKTYYILVNDEYEVASVIVGETIPEYTYYELNTENGTYNCEFQLSGFSYLKAYRFKFIVKDENSTIIANTELSSSETNIISVPVGIRLMGYYLDKIDFYNITKRKKPIYGVTTLYDNSSGTNGNIVLTDDSFANYEYIEIFYRYNTDDTYLSQKIYQPNGKKFQLSGNYDNGTRLYIATSIYTISGAYITRNSEVRWRFGTGGENNTRTDTTSSNNNIYIHRVIGYK